MATLDSYLQAQIAHGASHFVLQAGREIVFVFDGEERHMTVERCDPATVASLLSEIAPIDVVPAIRGNSPFEFRYLCGERTFSCTGHPTPLGPKAVFALSERAQSVVDVGAEATAFSTPTSVADVLIEPAIHRLFRTMVERNASDLHLSSDEPPMLRDSGDMVRLDGEPRLSDEALRELLFEIAPARNREEFLETGDTDFAHEIPGLARFRANYFRDRNGMGAVFRQIPTKILSVDDLGLPDEVRQLCFLSKGLVLVTGPTGSGKSTTLAALIDLVNRQRKDHIITIEDPIEFVHPNKGCLINQREVRIHTRTFSSALRAALREDPDIVLVGEMRDLETISIAIETAETGHLVFGTLHTSTAPSTVDRLIDVFPADRQDQIRVMLSESLKGVIAQTLCRKTGGGRAAAYEILIGTPSVSALIREGKTFQIPSVMQTGKKYGMCTLNDSLTDLVRRRTVEAREAYIKAVDKQGLLGMFKSNGIDTSFLAELGGG
jgi:twitching motility protein PilT